MANQALHEENLHRDTARIGKWTEDEMKKQKNVRTMQKMHEGMF